MQNLHKIRQPAYISTVVPPPSGAVYPSREIAKHRDSEVDRGGSDVVGVVARILLIKNASREWPAPSARSG